MKKLSRNLTYREAITSQTASRKGISNKPDKDTLERMTLLATEVFQKVRDHFGKPIRVSSFYRSPLVNTAVGGSRTSQHMSGEAIDLQGTNGLKNSEIFKYIKDNLDFDQLIWEFGNTKEPAWVHVSYRGCTRGRNRKQVFAIGVNKQF